MNQLEQRVKVLEDQVKELSNVKDHEVLSIFGSFYYEGSEEECYSYLLALTGSTNAGFFRVAKKI